MKSWIIARLVAAGAFVVGLGLRPALLDNPITGLWFQAWHYSLGTYGCFGGTWQPGLTIVAGRPVR